VTANAPQYGIVVMPKGTETDERGKPVLMLCLSVSDSATQAQMYLCDAQDNYQDVAKKFHDMICQAGRDARRAQSGLVVVEGGSDAFRTEKQGGLISGPRGKGS
jgi:hypothetical protein